MLSLNFERAFNPFVKNNQFIISSTPLFSHKPPPPVKLLSLPGVSPLPEAAAERHNSWYAHSLSF